jgi:hypothetical protein
MQDDTGRPPGTSGFQTPAVFYEAKEKAYHDIMSLEPVASYLGFLYELESVGFPHLDSFLESINVISSPKYVLLIYLSWAHYCSDVAVDATSIGVYADVFPSAFEVVLVSLRCVSAFAVRCATSTAAWCPGLRPNICMLVSGLPRLI